MRWHLIRRHQYQRWNYKYFCSCLIFTVLILVSCSSIQKPLARSGTIMASAAVSETVDLNCSIVLLHTELRTAKALEKLFKRELDDYVIFALLLPLTPPFCLPNVVLIHRS